MLEAREPVPARLASGRPRQRPRRRAGRRPRRHARRGAARAWATIASRCGGTVAGRLGERIAVGLAGLRVPAEPLEQVGLEQQRHEAERIDPAARPTRRRARPARSPCARHMAASFSQASPRSGSAAVACSSSAARRGRVAARRRRGRPRPRARRRVRWSAIVLHGGFLARLPPKRKRRACRPAVSSWSRPSA